jgi:hypothetical protein
MKPLPDNIGEPLKKLLAARDELHKSFSSLNFDLSANVVQHIGEAIAVAEFKLENTHDGFIAPNGTNVQIRTTQKLSGRVLLILEPFQHLLVIQLSDSGTYSILYNGPACYINKDSSSNCTFLSMSYLHQLNHEVRDEERLCGH